MNSTVENYLINGCGRCAFYASVNCKVRNFQAELELLRQILLQTELKEEVKWGQPCYSYKGKNVVMIVTLKSACCLSFFKGALLKDPENLLVKPGAHSQSDRLLKFSKVQEILDNRKRIDSFIAQGIELEQNNIKFTFEQNPEPIPQELLDALACDAELSRAFYGLPKGKQRGYILYFSQAKSSKSKLSRIEKSIPKILNGEGLHDIYGSKKPND
jgi:uncharacterized protein YdeI (YjbR/CyaY-like superfamily)